MKMDQANHKCDINLIQITISLNVALAWLYSAIYCDFVHSPSGNVVNKEVVNIERFDRPIP